MSTIETLYVSGDVRITMTSESGPFQIDSSPAPTFTLITTPSSGSIVLLDHVTGVIDVTSPADLNAVEKTLSYSLPTGVGPGDYIATFDFSAQGQTFSYDLEISLIPIPEEDRLIGVNGFPPIAVAFTDAVSASVLLDPTALRVWRTSLLNYQGEVDVAGSWSIIDSRVMPPSEQPGGPGSTLVFTPDEPIKYNCRYTIFVGPRTHSPSGDYIPEPVISSFLSSLTPFYVNPYTIRMKLGEFSSYFDEEQVLYAGWEASMTCNRETQWYTTWAVGGPTTDSVTRWNYRRTYAMDKFTEIEACINLLKSLLAPTLDTAGQTRKLPGFESIDSIQRIDGLKKALKMLEQEREPYYSEISFKRPHVRTAGKGRFNQQGLTDRSWTARPNLSGRKMINPQKGF